MASTRSPRARTVPPFRSSRGALSFSGGAGNFWGHNVRQPGWPPRLSPCVDPRTWGAVKVHGATFFDRHPHTSPRDFSVRVNEFFLQYPDPTTAQQAAERAIQQLLNCPSPGRTFGQSPGPHSSTSHLMPS